LDQSPGLEIRAPLVLAEQPGQDCGVIIDDGIGDQPRALVADLNLDVGLAGDFFLAADLRDGRGIDKIVGELPVALPGVAQQI
jgi:hypothetical protein